MTNAPALLQKDITDQISLKLGELQDEGLQLPAGYNPNNALKSAFFELKNVKDRNKRPALDVCTKESIANTLLNMVTQGLSPAKTQCYFIVYGDQLQMQRSYFGTQTVLKRLSGVKDIWANVIHEGDEFDVQFDEKGRERLKHHNGQARNAITNNIHSVRFGSGGSLAVRAMQRRLGVTIDGLIGPLTTRALQRRMGTPVTGGISRTNSAVVKEMQRRLNEDKF